MYLPISARLMILNAYAVLDGFLSVMRLGLAVVVLFLVVSLIAKLRAADGQWIGRFDGSWYLATSLAAVLFSLSIVAWPMLYAVLQSYVPQWEGVMCIYGVLKVGTNSHGASGALPALLAALQLTKPALIAVGGVWFVLYRLNRTTSTAALSYRVLASLAALALLTMTDSALEVAYLVIPKNEDFLDAGCCMMGAEQLSNGDVWPFPFDAWISSDKVTWCYYAATGLMIAALAIPPFAGVKKLGRLYYAVLFSGALAAIPITWRFIVDSVAPTLLRQPDHHCPFDLFARFPETFVAAAAVLAGSFSVAWACVAFWCRDQVTPAVQWDYAARLLSVSLFAYVTSVTLFVVELFLA